MNRLAPLPDLPALAAGKDGDRVAYWCVFKQREIGRQQLAQLIRKDAEGRTFGLVADEEKPGQYAAARQQFGDAPAPIVPELARQGAEEGTFVDQADWSGRGEGEKVGANEVDRSTRQNLAGLFDGDRRKIQRGNARWAASQALPQPGISVLSGNGWREMKSAKASGTLPASQGVTPSPKRLHQKSGCSGRCSGGLTASLMVFSGRGLIDRRRLRGSSGRNRAAGHRRWGLPADGHPGHKTRRQAPV